MRITIIGCGNMGSGIAQRFAPLHDVYLYDRNMQKVEQLVKQGCGKVCHNLDEAFKTSDILLLAIKPQNLDAFVQTIPSQTKKDQTILSILSGVTLKKLQSLFPNNTVVRMMPNLAIIYGEGLIGLAAENLSSEQKEVYTDLCSSLGKVYWFPEPKFNAFTSLGGCGPAFVLTLIEAMTESGIAMGFNAKDSLHIVLQMIKGSIELLEKGDEHPAELRWKIASPGGLTIAGMRKMEELGVRAGIMNTFLATYERTKELENE
ncbi:MAG: pyrroline-5-carboxylate reductase [Parachlamydiales bacterium]|jgi:pyrroline-5-carboxylate reductase